jgi:hypothetical protein
MTSLGYCARFSRPLLRSLNCFAQIQAAKPAIAPCSTLRSLLDECRFAFRATHPAVPSPEELIVARIAGEQESTGAFPDGTGGLGYPLKAAENRASNRK